MKLLRDKFRMILVKYLASLSIIELNCLIHEVHYTKEVETNSHRKFITKVFIDRNKLLDEAVFSAINGLEQIRNEMFRTGKVRLGIARAKLDEAIKKLEEDGC